MVKSQSFPNFSPYSLSATIVKIVTSEVIFDEIFLEIREIDQRRETFVADI